MGECFKQLPHTDAPRHSNDAGFTAGVLMALRANHADGYKSLLALSIKQLESDVGAEVERDRLLDPGHHLSN